MLAQTYSELTEAQIKYVEKCRERALAANLATFPVTYQGHKAVAVQSQSEQGCWHIVRKLGKRYVCGCKAMYTPANPETGEAGKFDRYVACIHTQTVYLILEGKLERHATPL